MICARPAFRLVRGLSAALALLTFVSPVLDSLHEARVRHVRCPEDGELIDAPLEAPHAHAATPLDGTALFGEQDSDRPPRQGPVHEHCAVAHRARLHAVEVSGVPTVVDEAAAAREPRAAEEASRRAAVAVYRFAPKASPPA
ncbi:MAG TPA: hypothetical protein VGH20_01705 [Myxococcales bacterium]